MRPPLAYVERMVRPVHVAAATGAAFLLAGCGAADDEGGFGVPRQETPGQIEGERTPIAGTVVITDNGCLHLEIDGATAPWIVWPPDAAIGDQGGVEVDEVQYDDGVEVRATGALVALEDLPDGGNPDGYFASFGGFCGADDAGVVVLDRVERAGG